MTEATVKLTPVQKLQEKAQVLAAKINSLTADYQAAVTQLQALEALGNIREGNTITYKAKHGEQEAYVLGVNGDQLKVTYGTGFDTATAVIKLGAVLRVVPEPAQDVTESAIDVEAVVAAI